MLKYLMALNNKYGGLIWTNHALERLSQRNLNQNYAFSAFTDPDRTVPGKKNNTTEYQKRIQQYKVTVIATKNDKNENVILSCWVDPPMPGSIDKEKNKMYREYQKGSFWKKLWITVKVQLGLSKV